MPSSFHGMWPLKLTSSIIPLAEDPTRLEAELAWFFRNKKAVGFGAWGVSLGFEFGVVCPSANPQVEREDSARGSGGLDVFQLSVGL